MSASGDAGSTGTGIVFIIASHRNPAQVVRLVRRLLADLPAARVVIHHDRSISTLERESLPHDGVDLIDPPIAVRWGDASQVRATVRCLDHIVRVLPEYEWVVFLSGQDYPVRHLRDLPEALEAMRDGQLAVEPPQTAEPLRYELTWFRLPEALQRPSVRALFERLIFHLNHRQRIVRFASGRLGCSIGARLPSPLPAGWRCYQGSNWWALRRSAIETFLSIRRERRALYAWLLDRSIVPDEGIFQTVLLNVPGLTLTNADIRYIRWDDRLTGSPAILTMRDASVLETSGRFFARKFDTDVDAAILDELDRIAARPAGV
jgi:hypothetical protein